MHYFLDYPYRVSSFLYDKEIFTGRNIINLEKNPSASKIVLTRHSHTSHMNAT